MLLLRIILGLFGKKPEAARSRGLTVAVRIEPLKRRELMADADYKTVRAILKSLSDTGKYFAYCAGDDTLIWHEGRGPWQRDDDGAQFLAFARAMASDREARLALAYFKDHCISSGIDPAMKAKRLKRSPTTG